MRYSLPVRNAPRHPDFEYNLSSVPNILIQHGSLDPMVDIDRGRRIRDVLSEAGQAPHYIEYSMGHEISNESLFDLRDWLATA